MTTIYHEQGFDEDKYFGIQIECPDCNGQGCWKCGEKGWTIVSGDADLEYATKEIIISGIEEVR